MFLSVATQHLSKILQTPVGECGAFSIESPPGDSPSGLTQWNGRFDRRLRAGVGVAWAEMRSARRLARTWLFIVLSLGGGLLAFFGLTVMQVLGSTLSPSFAAFGPRFLVASVGVFVLWLFMVALLFLAFDVRARDRRDRMVDVLDSRPVGNLALLSSRLAGLVLTVWLPLVVLIGLFQGFGMLARALEWPFGDPLEPLSALAFLTIDALPMLALWCALVILLAVVLRNRLVVALVAIAILGAHWWVLTRSPGYLLPVVSGLTGYTVTPSDVQPVFAAPTDIAQRLALLLLAGGLLVLAAAVHPRPDRASAQAQLAGSAALLVAGCAVLGGLGWRAVDALETRDAWRAAHEARQDSPAPALERVEGLVHVDPGDDLTLDLDLSLRTAHTPIDEIAFAFNPAMTVTALAVNGAPVSFTHEHGLLIAALPTRLQPGESIVASIAAAGVPDTTFGYLDSAVDVPRLTADAGNLLLLGGPRPASSTTPMSRSCRRCSGCPCPARLPVATRPGATAPTSSRLTWPCRRRRNGWSPVRACGTARQAPIASAPTRPCPPWPCWPGRSSVASPKSRVLRWNC